MVLLPLHIPSWVCIPVPAQAPGSLLVCNNIRCKVQADLPSKAICSFLLAHQLMWLVRLPLVFASIFGSLDMRVCIFYFWIPFFHSVSHLTISMKKSTENCVGTFLHSDMSSSVTVNGQTMFLTVPYVNQISASEVSCLKIPPLLITHFFHRKGPLARYP